MYDAQFKIHPKFFEPKNSSMYTHTNVYVCVCVCEGTMKIGIDDCLGVSLHVTHYTVLTFIITCNATIPAPAAADSFCYSVLDRIGCKRVSQCWRQLNRLNSTQLNTIQYAALND